MTKIPGHVAIIMDGNGRWAQGRGRPRVFGHIRGAGRVHEVVETASNMGVKALTLYAFSTENWSRPEGELTVLWKLLIKFLKREVDALDKKNVRFNVFGQLERLSPEVQAVVRSTVERLSKNTGMFFNLALSYGSQNELVQAAQAFARDCLSDQTSPEKLTPSGFENYLLTKVLGQNQKVDLLIRTSGEQRLSNFLLWQCAYAEFVFLNQHWPDFSAATFREAVEVYQKRDRRFGGLSA